VVIIYAGWNKPYHACVLQKRRLTGCYMVWDFTWIDILFSVSLHSPYFIDRCVLMTLSTASTWRSQATPLSTPISLSVCKFPADKSVLSAGTEVGMSARATEHLFCCIQTGSSGPPTIIKSSRLPWFSALPLHIPFGISVGILASLVILLSEVNHWHFLPNPSQSVIQNYHIISH
jgi:hypothetical protein